MKRLVALLLILFVVFVIVERQRLYLWDPIVKVSRDGAADTQARAMINFSNDLLLFDDSANQHRVYILQNWNQVLQAPLRLRCLGRLACLTDADQAAGTPVPVGSRGRRSPFVGVTMTNRRVEFVDEDGALVQVVIR